MKAGDRWFQVRKTQRPVPCRCPEQFCQHEDGYLSQSGYEVWDTVYDGPPDDQDCWRFATRREALSAAERLNTEAGCVD